MRDTIRTPRFSGRERHPSGTFLMGCVLVCLTVPGLRAQAPEGDPQPDRVVALVERLGGQIERDENTPGRPVVGIRLATTRISDDQLGELRGLSSLRSLDLTQTRISDSGLARLRGHEGLRSLVLFDTRVTDAGFASIATLSGLETLVVGLCDVAGPGLSHLESLNHLKTLSLFVLNVTDETLAPVARLTRLERLDLVGLKITDAGLVHLRGLTRLRQLSLDGFHDASAVTDAGLAQLAGLTELRQLSLEKTRVTDAGLIHLRGLPNLKRLRHAGTAITPAGLSQLAHLDRDRNPATDGAVGPKTPEVTSGPAEIVAPVDGSPAQVRTAVARALPPLQQSLLVYAEKRDCFSCHNQGVPLIALNIARSRGLAIDEDAFQGAVALTLADLESALAQYRQGHGQAGGATRAAYALWALEAGDHPPDEITAAVTEYLQKANRDQDHWTSFGQPRVPMEGSPFTATALALRGLRSYGSNARSDVAKELVPVRLVPGWQRASPPTPRTASSASGAWNTPPQHPRRSRPRRRSCSRLQRRWGWAPGRAPWRRLTRTQPDPPLWHCTRPAASRPMILPTGAGSPSCCTRRRTTGPGS